MSEKRLRFTMESDKLYSCIFDNGNELTCFELVDLLNKLYDENRELNDEVNDYIKLYKSSIAENEQLKKELKKITEILENGGVLLTEKQLLSICENKEIWNVDPVTDTVLKG